MKSLVEKLPGQFEVIEPLRLRSSATGSADVAIVLAAFASYTIRTHSMGARLGRLSPRVPCPVFDTS